MTKRQQEKQVLDHIKERGGASIFWITDYIQRAWAVTRLENRYRIRRHMKSKRDHYPWCVFTISDKTEQIRLRRLEKKRLQTRTLSIKVIWTQPL